MGIVSVPDERLDKLAEMYHPVKFTPATLEFVDIAGLVKGASKGEGLGNKFLSNIREVDAIVHVVRCFDDLTSFMLTALSILAEILKLSIWSLFSLTLSLSRESLTELRRQ